MDFKTWTNSVPFILSVFLMGPFGGMGVFALQKKIWPTPISQRVQQAGGSALLNLWMKEYGYWWLRPQLRILLACGATPSFVTFAGLGVVYAGCALVGCGWFAIGGLCILLGSLSDMLDGMVARARNTCTPAGEFVDSMVDRYADLGLFAGLLAYYMSRPDIVALIAAAASGSMLVSYTRSKAESLGLWDVPSGLMQRAERAVYLGFGIYLGPVVAHWTEAPSPQPRYLLTVLAIAIVALLTHLSALRMNVWIYATLQRREGTRTSCEDVMQPGAGQVDDRAAADAPAALPRPSVAAPVPRPVAEAGAP